MKLLPRTPAKSSTWGDWRSPDAPTPAPQADKDSSTLRLLAYLGTVSVASYWAGQLLGYVLGLN